jgi:hypothetical protein
MTWKKVHIDGEVWEWQVGKPKEHNIYVVIRAPSGMVTRFLWEEYVDDSKGYHFYVAVTPYHVKNYIIRNKAALSMKSVKRQKRELGQRK